MLYQTTGHCEINIYSDLTFSENLTDNTNKYDHIYSDESIYKPTSFFGIKIFISEELFKSALIRATGGATGLHQTSVIVEDDRFLICCCGSIFCLSIADLLLLWRTEADMASCFQIFKYEEGYIVHGELQISRLDKNGKIIWQQGGADIFTTPEGRDEFMLMDNYILATDWDHRQYKFDYNGQIL